MLRKILIVAKRDYIESVRTKAFLFGLIVAPILFGSGFAGLALLKSKPDIAERRIAVMDHSRIAAADIIESIRERNEHDLKDKTGRQLIPVYRLEEAAPDEAHIEAQRLALSARVRSGDLYGFLEIGANAIHPDSRGEDAAANSISLYSNESAVGDAKRWLSPALNDGIRRVRMRQLGVDPKQFHGLLDNVNIESMNLVSRDEKGALHPAEKLTQATVFVPVALVMMLLMIVMITSAPMLNAIAEDKMQRVFEMLLASATPFELITGKVLAALGRALTSSLLYIAGAILVLNAMALMGIAPIGVLPWFLIYLVAEITMLCAIAAALGAACGSPQDAQSLGILLFGPIMIPTMMIASVMQRPNGALATVMSFIPPFTPVIMLVRQSMPGGVPAWQPWAALAGLIAGLVATCWVAARIFRIGILLQGKPPNFAELARWAIRG